MCIAWYNYQEIELQKNQQAVLFIFSFPYLSNNMKRILWLTLCSEAHPCQVGLLWERQWFSVYDLSSLAPEIEQLYAKGLISIKPSTWWHHNKQAQPICEHKAQALGRIFWFCLLISLVKNVIINSVSHCSKVFADVPLLLLLLCFWIS